MNGKQFLRSTEKTTKKEAEKVLAEFNLMHGAKKAGALTREFYLSLAGEVAKSITLHAAVDQWLEDTETRTGTTTYAKYRTEVYGLRDYLNATEEAPALDEIDAHAIRRYLQSRQKTTSTANANTGKKILSSFFEWHFKNDQLAANPVKKVSRLKESAVEKRRSKRRAFTLEEVQAAYEVAPDDFWRFMLLIGFFTGLRLGDAVSLMWENVDFKQGFIRVRTAKTDKPVSVPIHPTLGALLVQLAKQTGRVKPSGYIWPDRAASYQKKRTGTLSNEFHRVILVAAGLVDARDHKAKGKGRDTRRAESHLSFHSLRHTFISLLKLTGGNQAIAKELAGHTSDLVSDLYTHVPVDALKGAIAALPEVGI